MKSWLLVGHRGVGKSSLLSELKKEFSQSAWRFLSLDEQIVERSGQTIDHIFKKEGEKAFRTLEKETLASICGAGVVVDVGAGFEGPLPEGSKTLWVTRKIDSSQSQFLDRPPLDGKILISQNRFNEREARYKKWADLKLELREGTSFFNEGEKLFFRALFEEAFETDKLSSWLWTLQRTSTTDETDILKRLGLKHFEWRDDLLASIPPHLSSLRSYRDVQKKEQATLGLYDWPLEWGVKSEAPILSLHQRRGTFQETLATLPDLAEPILKIALETNSFEELSQGNDWMMEKEGKRSFLPMSLSGRWAWFRLVSQQSQALNFLRFSSRTAPDQPSLLECLNFNPEFKNFAAILGSPVEHSHTPTFHQNFFNQKKCNVVAIDLKEDEFDQALPVLEKMGMVAAAVTSPLKEKAAKWLGQGGQAINTLGFDGEKWRGTSTDYFGLEAMIPEESRKSVAVWGGGGVHTDLKKLLPEACFYSSRTGALKEGMDIQSSESLIWAVGPSSFDKKGVYPPKSWPVKSVFDLNYTQNSPAIAWAHKSGCQYHSGLVMFAAQARKQQEFWNECGL